jgi:hypothetical protein
MSKEEKYLKQIISSCELILDDMEQGAKISQSNFNMLGFADHLMLNIQQQISKQLNPSHYKSDIFYDDDPTNHAL